MESMNLLNENELVLLLKEGNSAAFAELYDRYYQLLFRYALRVLNDRDDADDVTQEVLISLYIKRDQLETKSLSSLLYLSVRNRALDKIDHLKVRARYRAAVMYSEAPGCNATEEQVNYAELKSIIESALVKLPARTREVFIMSRIHEKSYKEISEHFNLSKDVVKKQVSNALRMLRMKIHTFIAFFL